MKIWLNGKLVDEKDAVVSVFDHGFLYGDGVFEGIRIYNRRIFKWKEHLDRLYDSAKILGIEIGMTPEEMTAAVKETIRANGIYDKGYIRLVVSRGRGDLGINPKKCEGKPTVVIIVSTIAIYPEERYQTGVRAIVCSVRKNRVDSLPPQAKTLNYVNNILGVIEVNNAGVEEGIMLTEDGYVAEATVDNIFVVKSGRITTPPVYLGILDGITRRTVIEIIKKEDIPFRESPLTISDLYTADEIFVTGTAAELMPIVEVDSRKVGNGKPGPLFNKLREEFRKITENEGEPID